MDLPARLAFGLAFIGCLAAVHRDGAAHAAIGTPVPNLELQTLAGGKAMVLDGAQANVLVLFRPKQERSQGALRELANCQSEFAGKPVRWAAVVSDSVPADEVGTLVRDTRFQAPVLIDQGDALYGSLGLALHPVVVIVGQDKKLAAFEPFRSLGFCSVVGARVRHLLREISDDDLQRALEPPRSKEGGDGQVAKRYLAFAQSLFKSQHYEKALENVRKSVEKDASNASAHLLLGQILAAQGNCGAAAGAFEQALKLDAANAAAAQGMQACKEKSRRGIE